MKTDIPFSFRFRSELAARAFEALCHERESCETHASSDPVNARHCVSGRAIGSVSLMRIESYATAIRVFSAMQLDN